MGRPIRNTLVLIGCLLGAALLLFGIMALSFDDREGWTYIGGSVVSFAVAFAFRVRKTDRR